MSGRGLALTLVVGATIGGLFGLTATSSPPEATPANVANASPEPLPLLPPPSAAPSNAAAGPAPSAAVAASAPSASSSARAAGSADGGAGAAGTLAASARPPAFDLTEPASEPALIDAQLACNRKSPEACERAARSLDSGSAGVKDPSRARSLRKIALTLYVKQCETSRALACARLAEMYETGFIVQPNPRNAAALRQRVDELCARRKDEPGCPQ